MFRIPQYKIQLVREKSSLYETKRITGSYDAANIVSQYIGNTDRENLVVLLLDIKNKVIGINTVSVGSLNGSIANTREIFKPAILSNAAAIILAHNHPSGETYPSADDDKTTKRVREAGKIMDIPLLDHIIVGLDANHYYSYADERKIKEDD